MSKRTSKLSCALCGDGASLLHLHAACHLQAPLRLEYRRTKEDQGVLFVTCYVPDCGRPVAAFGVDAVVHSEKREEATSLAALQNDCDLCNDNDTHRLCAVPVRGLVEFTAPFRLEHHRAPDGRRSLHVFCYLQKCNRLFAVLAVDDVDYFRL